MTDRRVRRVLVFSRTTGFRHESIPAGVTALTELAATSGFAVVATEDPDGFTREELAAYDTVVFLNTSGDVFTDEHRAAVKAYVRGGGGFVGVHCAAATETGWAFYATLLGARFADHPDIQPGTIRVEDHAHPATAHLGPTWPRTDEWYNLDRSPRGQVRVLLSLDESTYAGGAMGEDHPIAWCHSPAGGRAFYTALGHTIESYAEPAFRAHLAGAIAWTVREEAAPGEAARGD